MKRLNSNDFAKRFDIAEEPIGEGGFGYVYKAYDRFLKKNVALKYTEDNGLHNHELLIIKDKSHKNIYEIYDGFVVEDNSGFDYQVVVMNLIEGHTIDIYLDMHPEYLNKLLIDVLEGLDYVHSHNIVHCDLNQYNILIGNENNSPIAKIIDFGISKHLLNISNDDELYGKIQYMAPEQLYPNKFGIGGKISNNVDYWGFGIMLYELLENKNFIKKMPDDQDTMDDICFSPLKDYSHIKEPYKKILDKCLVRDANKRIKNSKPLINLLTNDYDIKIINEKIGISSQVIEIANYIYDNLYKMAKMNKILDEKCTDEIELDFTEWDYKIVFRNQIKDVIYPIMLGGSMYTGIERIANSTKICRTPDDPIIYLKFWVNENHTYRDLFNVIKKNKSTVIKSLSHELKHFEDFERMIPKTLEEFINGRISHELLNMQFIENNPILKDLVYIMYVTTYDEEKVFYSEIYGELTSNKKLYKTNFIKKLNEINRIKKVKYYMKYSYIDLKNDIYNITKIEGDNYLKFVFDDVIVPTIDDLVEDNKKYFNEFECDKYLNKLHNMTYEKYFKYEIEKINNTCTKMYRKIVKIYSLI